MLIITTSSLPSHTYTLTTSHPLPHLGCLVLQFYPVAREGGEERGKGGGVGLVGE